MFTMIPAAVKNAGVAVTYATWDPANKGTLIVLSGANRGMTSTAPVTGTWNMVRALLPKTAGKWYAECTDNTGSGYGYSGGFGLSTSASNLAAELGSDAAGWGYYGKRGDTAHPLMEHSGAITNYNTLPNGIAGTVYRLAYDADAGKVWIGSGTNWAGGGDPATGTTPTFTVTPGTSLMLAAGAQNSSMSYLLNAGQVAFSNTVPTGFNPGWYV